MARPTRLSLKDAGRRLGLTLPPAAWDSDGHNSGPRAGRRPGWGFAGATHRPLDLQERCCPVSPATRAGFPRRRPRSLETRLGTRPSLCSGRPHSAGRLRGLLACDPRGSYTRTCANTSSRESWATGDLVVMLERERPLRAGCKPQKPQRKDHQPDRCNHTAKYLKPGKAFAINKTHGD